MGGSGSLGRGVIDVSHRLLELFGRSGVVVVLLYFGRIHGIELQSLHRSFNIYSLTSRGGRVCGGGV